MAHKRGKFIWYEHVSPDPSQARAFYAELFGWRVDDVPMGGAPYPMLHNAGVPIGGLRADASGVPSHWASWISTDDVDATARLAEQNGAKVALPPTDFPGAGRGAVLQDPQGAYVGIWTSAGGSDPDDVERASPGAFCWTELTTSDPDAALAFYRSVFGYTSEAMPMPEGAYHLLKRDGALRGGLMRNPQPGMPPCWTPYVEVADADATAAKAKSLGAQICVAPTDIPNVGRFAVLQDPQGAVLGIIRSAA